MEFKDLRLISRFARNRKETGINLVYDRKATLWIVSRSKMDETEDGVILSKEDILGVCPTPRLALDFYDIFCKVYLVQELYDDPGAEVAIQQLLPVLREQIEEVKAWWDPGEEEYGVPIDYPIEIKVDTLEELTQISHQNWHSAEAYLDQYNQNTVSIPYTSLDASTKNTIKDLGYASPEEAVEDLTGELSLRFKEYCKKKGVAL